MFFNLILNKWIFVISILLLQIFPSAYISKNKGWIYSYGTVHIDDDYSYGNLVRIDYRVFLMLSKKLRRCLCHIEFYVQKKKLKLKQKIMIYFFTMVKWISFIFIAGYMVYKYQEPFIKIYKEIKWHSSSIFNVRCCIIISL